MVQQLVLLCNNMNIFQLFSTKWLGYNCISWLPVSIFPKIIIIFMVYGGSLLFLMYLESENGYVLENK